MVHSLGSSANFAACLLAHICVGKPSNASAEVQCPGPPISPIKFFVGSTSTCSSEDQPHASRCMSPSPSPKTQTKVNLKECLQSMGKRKRGGDEDDSENGPSTKDSRRMKKTCPLSSHEQTTCTL
ncbi:hypothetical protein ONZ45_g18631 [Pleurotus djamor]|nr:hypothetical protein ONZ45_g18631 [Pleurotus djamor]